MWLSCRSVETADTMKLFDALSNLSALTLHHEKRGRLLQVRLPITCHVVAEAGRLLERVRKQVVWLNGLRRRGTGHGAACHKPCGARHLVLFMDGTQRLSSLGLTGHSFPPSSHSARPRHSFTVTAGLSHKSPGFPPDALLFNPSTQSSFRFRSAAQR